MVKSTSTTAIIEALMAYEKENGVGSVTSIGTVCSGDRTVEYILHIKNKEGDTINVEIPTLNESTFLKEET